MALAIKVENLSKAYQLGEIGTGTISRDLERWFARLRGKEDPFLVIGETNNRASKGTSDIVWSLKDVNFEITQGDAVGIIGRNGAGKSTLLKILSRITSPTTGEISVKGRIASLLEVGTGFHPELTGRENIFLNGAILGMRKKEIGRKFDEIVDFAGVERYIDTPVKRYSSGMYVRLAFAVAANLESEILIVDEVLAVGDAEFQEKCLGKMQNVSEAEGRTVLFVSHNMGAVMNLCQKAILIKNGMIDKLGDTSAIISHYRQTILNNSYEWKSTKKKTCPHFDKVVIDVNGKQPDLILKVAFDVNSPIMHKPLFVAFDIANSIGMTIMQAIPISYPFINYSENLQNFVCEISLRGLIPDTYSLSTWIGEHYTLTSDWQKEIVSFEITSSPIKDRTIPFNYANGFYIPDSKIII